MIVMRPCGVPAVFLEKRAFGNITPNSSSTKELILLPDKMSNLLFLSLEGPAWPHDFHSPHCHMLRQLTKEVFFHFLPAKSAKSTLKNKVKANYYPHNSSLTFSLSLALSLPFSLSPSLSASAECGCGRWRCSLLLISRLLACGLCSWEAVPSLHGVHMFPLCMCHCPLQDA